MWMHIIGRCAKRVWEIGDGMLVLRAPRAVGDTLTHVTSAVCSVVTAQGSAGKSARSG